MWNVRGKQQVSSDWLNIEPVRTLLEYDGPKIFICKDIAGNPHLAFLLSEDRTRQRFLVVPFRSDLERQLTDGIMNLRDALTQPRAWVVDIGNDWRPESIWQIDVENLPPHVLPRPGVMLRPGLPSVLNRATPRPCSGELELTIKPSGKFYGSRKPIYA